MSNKALKILIMSALIVTAAAGFAAAGEWKSADADDFHLEWMVDGSNLNVKVSAPTDGWVAVGFDPSNKMKDADILIGYVEDGEVVIEDHYGNSAISHRSDEAGGGSSNLSNIGGSERNGVTELNFTIPLNSGDSRDRVLVEGESYKVIFASHTRDKITMKHNRRTSVQITL